MFVIERGVTRRIHLRPGRTPKYPYRELKVGDSFVVGREVKVTSVRNMAQGWRLSTGFKITVEKQDDGTCRVFRTA